MLQILPLGVGRSLECREVSGIFLKYLELKEVGLNLGVPYNLTFSYLSQIRPKLRKLTTLLNERPFTGEGEETGYSLAGLVDRVQASEDEIREALTTIQAVRVGGEWFLLDQDYQMKVLSFILK